MMRSCYDNAIKTWSIFQGDLDIAGVTRHLSLRPSNGAEHDLLHVKAGHRQRQGQL